MAQDSASAFLPRPWWMSAHFFHLALITLPAPFVPLQRSTERAQQAVKTVLKSPERCPIFFFFSGRTLLPIIAHQSAFALNATEGAIVHLSANSWPRRTHYHSSRSSIRQKKAEQNETWRQCLQRNSSSDFINCCDLIAWTERGKLALDGQTLGLRWGLDEKGVLRNVSKISLNNRRKSVILPRIFAFCAI